MATGTEKATVFARFSGQRLADLDMIVAHLTEQTNGVCSFSRTDAVYAAVRMASDILKGLYVKATREQRKRARRGARIDRAADGSTRHGGAPNPWPAGSIALPSARGTDRIERIEPDPTPNPGHADNGVPDESGLEESETPRANVRGRKPRRSQDR